MKAWTLKGPINGKFGDFFVYNDPALDAGVTISAKNVIDRNAIDICKAVNMKALNKIGIDPVAITTREDVKDYRAELDSMTPDQVMKEVAIQLFVMNKGRVR